jgi:hypothetical protein
MEYPSPFVKNETLRLSTLPCWKEMSDDEYRSHIRGLVDMIAEETAAMHAGQESEPLARIIQCATKAPSTSATLGDRFLQGWPSCHSNPGRRDSKPTDSDPQIAVSGQAPTQGLAELCPEGRERRSTMRYGWPRRGSNGFSDR